MRERKRRRATNERRTRSRGVVKEDEKRPSERKDEDKRREKQEQPIGEANKHCPQQGDQELSDKVTR